MLSRRDRIKNNSEASQRSRKNTDKSIKVNITEN